MAEGIPPEAWVEAARAAVVVVVPAETERRATVEAMRLNMLIMTGYNTSY